MRARWSTLILAQKVSQVFDDVLGQLMWFFGEERHFTEAFFHVDQVSKQAEREFDGGNVMASRVCAYALETIRGTFTTWKPRPVGSFWRLPGAICDQHILFRGCCSRSRPSLPRLPSPPQGKFTVKNHREMLDKMFAQLPALVDRIIEWSIKIDPINVVVLVSRTQHRGPLALHSC